MERAQILKIIALLDAEMSPLGYDCVDVRWESGERVLCIFIERQDKETVGIADCVKVNRKLIEHAGLDSLVGSDDYQLEVSSPGTDRPLRKLSHFQSAIGKKIDVRLTTEHQSDRRAGKGTVVSVKDDGVISVDTSRGAWSFPVGDVDQASIVFDKANKQMIGD